MTGVRQAIERVYTFETPDVLAQAGVEVFAGAARLRGSPDTHGWKRTRLRAYHFLVYIGLPTRFSGHPTRQRLHPDLGGKLPHASRTGWMHTDAGCQIAELDAPLDCLRKFLDVDMVELPAGGLRHPGCP
jgi:hypothetical protein